MAPASIPWKDVSNPPMISLQDPTLHLDSQSLRLRDELELSSCFSVLQPLNNPGLSLFSIQFHFWLCDTKPKTSTYLG